MVDVINKPRPHCQSEVICCFESLADAINSLDALEIDITVQNEPMSFWTGVRFKLDL